MSLDSMLSVDTNLLHKVMSLKRFVIHKILTRSKTVTDNFL